MGHKRSFLRLASAVLCALLVCSGCGSFAGSNFHSTTSPYADPLTPNPYNAGDFAYRNGYLYCASGKSALGVDVSEHQKQIDWPTVASQGIEFAMIRLGYRGYGEKGITKEDAYARINLQGAVDAGLQVGAYFYSQAISPEEAIEEANLALEILDGTPLSMPLVFDWEVFSAEGRTYNVDAQTMTACAVAFCQTVRAAGYEPMVYFNRDIAQRLLDLQQLQQLGVSFWLAQYGTMTYPYRVDMWQYTDTGIVKGIEGDVDLNLYFTYDNP